MSFTNRRSPSTHYNQQQQQPSTPYSASERRILPSPVSSAGTHDTTDGVRPTLSIYATGSRQVHASESLSTHSSSDYDEDDDEDEDDQDEGRQRPRSNSQRDGKSNASSYDDDDDEEEDASYFEDDNDDDDDYSSSYRMIDYYDDETTRHSVTASTVHTVLTPLESTTTAGATGGGVTSFFGLVKTSLFGGTGTGTTTTGTGTVDTAPTPHAYTLPSAQTKTRPPRSSPATTPQPQRRHSAKQQQQQRQRRGVQTPPSVPNRKPNKANPTKPPKQSRHKSSSPASSSSIPLSIGGGRPQGGKKKQQQQQRQRRRSTHRKQLLRSNNSFGSGGGGMSLGMDSHTTMTTTTDQLLLSRTSPQQRQGQQHGKPPQHKSLSKALDQANHHHHHRSSTTKPTNSNHHKQQTNTTKKQKQQQRRRRSTHKKQLLRSNNSFGSGGGGMSLGMDSHTTMTTTTDQLLLRRTSPQQRQGQQYGKPPQHKSLSKALDQANHHHHRSSTTKPTNNSNHHKKQTNTTTTRSTSSSDVVVHPQQQEHPEPQHEPRDSAVPRVLALSSTSLASSLAVKAPVVPNTKPHHPPTPYYYYHPNHPSSSSSPKRLSTTLAGSTTTVDPPPVSFPMLRHNQSHPPTSTSPKRYSIRTSTTTVPNPLLYTHGEGSPTTPTATTPHGPPYTPNDWYGRSLADSMTVATPSSAGITSTGMTNMTLGGSGSGSSDEDNAYLASREKLVFPPSSPWSSFYPGSVDGSQDSRDPDNARLSSSAGPTKKNKNKNRMKQQPQPEEETVQASTHTPDSDMAVQDPALQYPPRTNKSPPPKRPREVSRPDGGEDQPPLVKHTSTSNTTTTTTTTRALRKPIAKRIGTPGPGLLSIMAGQASPRLTPEDEYSLTAETSPSGNNPGVPSTTSAPTTRRIRSMPPTTNSPGVRSNRTLGQQEQEQEQEPVSRPNANTTKTKNTPSHSLPPRPRASTPIRHHSSPTHSHPITTIPEVPSSSYSGDLVTSPLFSTIASTTATTTSPLSLTSSLPSESVPGVVVESPTSLPETLPLPLSARTNSNLVVVDQNDGTKNSSENQADPPALVHSNSTTTTLPLPPPPRQPQEEAPLESAPATAPSSSTRGPRLSWLSTSTRKKNKTAKQQEEDALSTTAVATPRQEETNENEQQQQPVAANTKQHSSPFPSLMTGRRRRRQKETSELQPEKAATETEIHFSAKPETPSTPPDSVATWNGPGLWDTDTTVPAVGSNLSTLDDETETEPSPSAASNDELTTRSLPPSSPAVFPYQSPAARRRFLSFVDEADEKPEHTGKPSGRAPMGDATSRYNNTKTNKAVSTDTTTKSRRSEPSPLRRITNEHMELSPRKSKQDDYEEAEIVFEEDEQEMDRPLGTLWSNMQLWEVPDSQPYDFELDASNSPSTALGLQENQDMAAREGGVSHSYLDMGYSRSTSPIDIEDDQDTLPLQPNKTLVEDSESKTASISSMEALPSTNIQSSPLLRPSVSLSRDPSETLAQLKAAQTMQLQSESLPLGKLGDGSPLMGEELIDLSTTTSNDSFMEMVLPSITSRHDLMLNALCGSSSGGRLLQSSPQHASGNSSTKESEQALSHGTLDSTTTQAAGDTDHRPALPLKSFTTQGNHRTRSLPTTLPSGETTKLKIQEESRSMKTREEDEITVDMVLGPTDEKPLSLSSPCSPRRSPFFRKLKPQAQPKEEVGNGAALEKSTYTADGRLSTTSAGLLHEGAEDADEGDAMLMSTKTYKSADSDEDSGVAVPIDTNAGGSETRNALEEGLANTGGVRFVVSLETTPRMHEPAAPQLSSNTPRSILNKKGPHARHHYNEDGTPKLRSKPSILTTGSTSLESLFRPMLDFNPWKTPTSLATNNSTPKPSNAESSNRAQEERDCTEKQTISNNTPLSSRQKSQDDQSQCYEEGFERTLSTMSSISTMEEGKKHEQKPEKKKPEPIEEIHPPEQIEIEEADQDKSHGDQQEKSEEESVYSLQSKIDELITASEEQDELESLSNNRSNRLKRWKKRTRGMVRRLSTRDQSKQEEPNDTKGENAKRRNRLLLRRKQKPEPLDQVAEEEQPNDPQKEEEQLSDPKKENEQEKESKEEPEAEMEEHDGPETKPSDGDESDTSNHRNQQQEAKGEETNDEKDDHEPEEDRVETTKGAAVEPSNSKQDGTTKTKNNRRLSSIVRRYKNKKKDSTGTNGKNASRPFLRALRAKKDTSDMQPSSSNNVEELAPPLDHEDEYYEYVEEEEEYEQGKPDVTHTTKSNKRLSALRNLFKRRSMSGNKNHHQKFEDAYINKSESHNIVPEESYSYFSEGTREDEDLIHIISLSTSSGMDNPSVLTEPTDYGSHVDEESRLSNSGGRRKDAVIVEDVSSSSASSSTSSSRYHVSRSTPPLREVSTSGSSSRSSRSEDRTNNNNTFVKPMLQIDETVHEEEYHNGGGEDDDSVSQFFEACENDETHHPLANVVERQGRPGHHGHHPVSSVISDTTPKTRTSKRTTPKVSSLSHTKNKTADMYDDVAPSLTLSTSNSSTSSSSQNHAPVRTRSKDASSGKPYHKSFVSKSRTTSPKSNKKSAALDMDPLLDEYTTDLESDADENKSPLTKKLETAEDRLTRRLKKDLQLLNRIEKLRVARDTQQYSKTTATTSNGTRGHSRLDETAGILREVQAFVRQHKAERTQTGSSSLFRTQSMPICTNNPNYNHNNYNTSSGALVSHPPWTGGDLFSCGSTPAHVILEDE